MGFLFKKEGKMEALEKRSTLAIKMEMKALTGTASSSGTAVTGTGTAFNTELKVGGIVGNLTSGFRRVISIASATSMVVDSAYDPVLSSATLQSSDYGVDPTVAAADVMEFIDFTLESDRGEIVRNVIKNTFDEIEPIFGDETVTGNIQIELHGSGTAGTAPEADPLYHCACGERRISTASTTHATTPCTTTSIVLVTGGGAGFRVGEAIILDPTAGGTGAYEVSFITVISTDTLTVSPAFSAAPPTGRAVGAGVHYKISKNELKSIWAQFWRGDITLEKYKGCKVSELTMDFTTGQVANPSFAVQAKETAEPTSANYTLGTPSYDSGKPHVARYMVVTVGGTLYTVDKIAFSIANELYRILAVTSAGTQKIARTKRTVTGSFSLLYENKDIEAAFRAGTTAELMIVSSDGSANLVLGNTFATKFPKIKYTKATKGKDNGIYKYDVTFKAVMTSGEDSIAAASFL